MIIQLISDYCKDKVGYRSYLDTKNGDVIIQTTGDPSGFLHGYSTTGYWEAIVRGGKAQPKFPAYPIVDAHIDSKKQIIRHVFGFSENGIAKFEGLTLDAYLLTMAINDVREPDMEISNVLVL